LSIQTITASLEQLEVLHQDLLTISKQKTELVKTDAMDDLQKLLLKERKAVRKLEQAETKRQQEVEDWFHQNSLADQEATITNMLDVIKDETEQDKLVDVTTALTHTITELKQQEALNNSLISQSLEFVHMSMDLINPTLESMNYGNSNTTERTGRSLFDSRA